MDCDVADVRPRTDVQPPDLTLGTRRMTLDHH